MPGKDVLRHKSFAYWEAVLIPIIRPLKDRKTIKILKPIVTESSVSPTVLQTV